jgi:hypothetical protein
MQTVVIGYLWMLCWPPILVRPFWPRYDEDFFHAFLAYGLWVSDATLVAFWCGLTEMSLRRRVLVASIAYALLALNYTFFPRLVYRYGGVLLCAVIVAPAVVTLGGALLLRGASYRLRRDNREAVSTTQAGLQFGTRQVLLLMAGVAGLLVAVPFLGPMLVEVDKMQPRHLTIFEIELLRQLVIGIVYTVPCFLFFLAIFGSRNCVWRALTALAAVAFISGIHRIDPEDFPVSLILVSAAATSVISAFVLRLCGFRLIRDGFCLL